MSGSANGTEEVQYKRNERRECWTLQHDSSSRKGKEEKGIWDDILQSNPAKVFDSKSHSLLVLLLHVQFSLVSALASSS